MGAAHGASGQRVSFTVRYSAEAREDLRRLYRFQLDRGLAYGDFDVAERAYQTIVEAVEHLARAPFIYRKADGGNAFLRELPIPFGSSGYVALYEIEDAATVTILALRHQLEDDYH